MSRAIFPKSTSLFIPLVLLLTGCSQVFNHGLNPEQFLIGKNQPLGKEMLACMKPGELPLPTEFRSIIDDVTSLNPLFILSDMKYVTQIPLLTSYSKVTDFADSFFAHMPELLAPGNSLVSDSDIFKKYTKAYFSEEGFISRSGLKLKFPGLADGNSGTMAKPTSVDFTQVGTDLVRVVLESLRDGLKPETNRLPGVANATGVKENFLLDYSAATSLWHVYTKSADGIERKGVVTFDMIERKASQAEALLATALGKVARGGFWGSLNNEALAKVTETVAGIEARHVVERYEWCKSRTGGN